MKKLFFALAMIALMGCKKQEDRQAAPAPTQIDYAAIYVGRWLVSDSAYWNLLSTGGGIPDCLTNRVINNRTHYSNITKNISLNENYGIDISNYFGDSTQVIWGSIQSSNTNEIVFPLRPIKFKKTSCYIAPHGVDCEPDSCYYYIGLGNDFVHGKISSTGDTITLTYTNHASTQWGYAFMTVDGYFKSVLIRQ